jgi:hypothetical protein
MPDFARGDVVAIIAAQLLTPKERGSKKAIDRAVKQAVKIVAAAHEATKPTSTPEAHSSARFATSRSYPSV